MKLNITLNQKNKVIDAPTNRTLMEVLRSQGCWSIRHGCETASCGNCNVTLNGQAVYSCNMLAIQAAGKSVVTYENIQEDVKFDALRQAFANFVDPECCYCLSGFMLSLKALIDFNPEPVEEEIVDAVAGNRCHCATTPLPVDEIMSAIKRMRSA
ncbi:2Fe-2S iron-sulfur cluster-binding protein [bacterium]|nr:2Fe-2S iron-sulfur cluster-binding protein [bacterium]